MFGLFNISKKNNTGTKIETFAPLVTDMHCHLLPLVDDGSKSLDESIEVLKTMKEVGFEEVRITPHYTHPRFPNREDDIVEKYRKFYTDVNNMSEDCQLPMLKGVTGEYRIDDGFPGYVESGKMLTYRFADPSKGAPKGLLLIELSLHMASMDFDRTIFDLQMDGYDIILAHPERYPYFNLHSAELEQLKEQGVYFQTNILSLDGFYGEEPRKKAFEFIDAGWIEFLGTDMHNVVYAQGLRHAAANKKIRHLLEKVEFENSNLVEK